MKALQHPAQNVEDEYIERVSYDFGLNRRSFVQFLSAGLLIAASAPPAMGQQRGGRGGFGGSGAKSLGARLHIARDGSVTLLAGKVEAGQGARAELTQAAAEELGLPTSRISAVLSDTELTPDDGMTAGSGTSPNTVPAVRNAAASARALLLEFACKQWSVDAATLEMRDGKVVHKASGRELGYGDLASSEEWAKAGEHSIPSDVAVKPVKEWKLMGAPQDRPNGAEIVTGRHQFPSDIARDGMLYGKVLRAPSLGAKLTSVDAATAKAMPGIVVVQEDQFVGVAAPSTFQAEKALSALAATAKWEPAAEQHSSKDLYANLKRNAEGDHSNPYGEDLQQAKHILKQAYHVAYVQHSPLEPRAAVAEWHDEKLSVWTGTQNPFGCRAALARAFHIGDEKVRVIVPDFGAGFGGKHSGEGAAEAARLAKAAGKPVSLRWTRAEEFTWAYYRPAAVIEVEAGLDAQGTITSWHFININSGPSAIESPYRIAKHNTRFVSTKHPLAHGSYRALAATANTFARESAMDELALAAGADALEFRLAHLENARLRAVLEDAAKRFDWKTRAARKSPNIGVGLACGTEKRSYVAACAEVEIDRARGAILVRHVCESFECGAIINPSNLLKQVQGAIVMGLGPALREEMLFEQSEITNASYRKYQPPRFQDVPEMDIHLLDRPDLPSVGAGETPIIAIAPAIANAVAAATGTRVRSMPIRLAPA